MDWQRFYGNGPRPFSGTRAFGPQFKPGFFARLFGAKSQNWEPANPKVQPGWEILGGLPNWTDANQVWKSYSTSEREALYSVSTVVFACVRKICLVLTEAPLEAGKETEDGWADDKTHWARTLLRNPAPGMSGGEFLWQWQSHLQLTGVSYVWKWRNAAGNITELWPIPSSWVKRKAEGGYLVWQGQAKDWLQVPVKDMLRVIFPNPASPLEGIGPLQAASRPIQADAEREDYQMEMLANNRQPGIVFKQPEAWTEEQKSEVRATLQNQLGKSNRGRPFFLEGENASMEMMAAMKDIDWPGLTSLNEARICSAFGVPPIIIGLRCGLESATYSNYQQAERSFYQGTMLPLWAQSGLAFTHGLLRDEGDYEYEIYHDVEKLLPLAEDADRRAERAVKLFTGGLITRNEARSLAGEKTLGKSGDVFALSQKMKEVSAGEIGD
jgi:HK97 family phage portal protein